MLNDLQLLVILLPEYREMGFDTVEKLRHDRGDAHEMALRLSPQR